MLFLKSKKYVDDTIFAKLYIESELIKKGKPTIVVRQKLLEK
jgi:SOS response regulatory protein OraA/RecX